MLGPKRFKLNTSPVTGQVLIDAAALDHVKDFANKRFTDTRGTPDWEMVLFEGLYDTLRANGVEPQFVVVRK